MALFKETITKGKSGPGFIHRRSLVWIGLAVICLVLDRIVPDAFWETYYYHGFFTWIRRGYDILFFWNPVPLIYFWVLAILIRTWLWLKNWKKGFAWMASKAIGGIALLVFLFYFLWAFNYHQIALPERLGFNLKDVTHAEIENEFKRASWWLKLNADSLPPGMTIDSMLKHADVDAGKIRNEVKNSLGQLGLPNKGNVRVRQILPKGILLSWSTAGIYIPQTLEGHIDAGLLAIQKPFTMAHEISHGYGVADEGACNFIAWHALQISRDPWLSFCGAFTYWRYAAAEMDPDTVSAMMESMPLVVKRASKLIRENDAKYPDLMPKFRNAVYSNYLKRHGVKKGLRSYNEVVLMVQQYLKRKSMTPNPE